MVFLPFLPKKIPFFLLLILLSLIFSTGSVNSQVKIKEKVIIKPEATKTILKNNYSAQADHIVRIVYSGGGTFRVLAADYDVYIQDEAMFDAEGLYQWSITWAVDGVASCHNNAEIKVFLDENLINSILIVDACNAFGEFYILFPPPPPPPLPPFDFSIHLSPHQICGNQESVISFSYNRVYESLNDPNVQITFESNNPDLIFFDIYNEQSIGKILNTTLNKSDLYSIRSNSLKIDSTVQMKVIANSNGLTRFDSLSAAPPNFNYSLILRDRRKDILHGLSFKNSISSYANDDCTEQFMPDSIKYNLIIIQGVDLGSLIDPANGLRVKALYNQSHINGKLEFDYIADGAIPTDEDLVVIQISTTNSNIESREAKYTIRSEGLLVTFVPSSIAPGESANVIIKKKNGDGSLTEFPPGQLFDFKLIGGNDYGTIFVPAWGDTTDEAMYVEHGFSFNAMNPISNLPAESVLLVNTSGDMASSIVPNDQKLIKLFNQLMKQQKEETIAAEKKSSLIKNKFMGNVQGNKSTLDDTGQLWGTGRITISRSDSNSTHVKAYFEKPTLSPGDTSNIIIKMVDKSGNESDYPPETLFDVTILEGCGLGLINGVSEHLPGIQQPVKFVVANPITGTDSVIVLRVGAPSVETSLSSSIKAETNEVNRTKKTTAKSNLDKALIIKKKILAKVTGGTVCTNYPPSYADNAEAAATIGGGCDHLPCYTNNVPTAPTIDLIPFNNLDICNKKSGYAFTDYNLDGKSFPTEPLELLKYNVCYNKSLNRWILTLMTAPTLHTLKFQYEQDYCWNKINVNWYNKYQQYPIIIENYKTFVVSSDPNERALLKADLEAHLKYPISPDRIKKYVLKDFVIAHENGHVNNLREIINTVYASGKYADEFLNKFNYSCSKLNSVKMAQDTASKFLQNFEQKLLRAIAAEYQKKVLGSDFGDRERLESIHNANVYDHFMAQVFRRFGFLFIKANRWWL